MVELVVPMYGTWGGGGGGAGAYNTIFKIELLVKIILSKIINKKDVLESFSLLSFNFISFVFRLLPYKKRILI